MMWTEQRVALLRKLWDQKLSAGQIMDQLPGITRNAIIGKAHRLGLAKRQSPIKPRKPVPERSKRSASAQQRSTVLAGRRLDQGYGFPAAITGAHRTCRWPTGDPGKPGFHFCGAPSTDGHSYCQEHMAVAYVRGTGRAV